MQKNIILVAISIVLLSFASLSNATPIKVTFNGTIDQVVAGSYSVGQELSGFLIYDTETAISSYPTGSPPYTTNFGGAIDNLEIDSQKIDDVTFNILAQTSYYYPVDYKVSFSVAGYDEITGLRENLDLNFRGSSLLDSIYEILEDPNLADMSSATFGYTRQKVGLWDGFLQERFYGNVDSLEVTIVPEPSSLILLLTGLAYVFFKQAKRFRIGA